MAQYDGSILIDTKIHTKNASAQLLALENRMVKTADKIASLRSKMDALKDVQIPTQEYQNLQKELDKATHELEKMVAQDSKLADVDAKIKKLSQSSAEYAAKMKEAAGQKISTQEYTAAQKEVDKYSDSLQKAKEKIDKLLELGVNKKSSRFVSAQYDVAKLENKLLDAEEVVKRLEQEGKAFTLGTDTEQYKNFSEKYKQVNAELEKQKGIHSEIVQKQADAVRKTIELKAQMQQLVDAGKAFTLGGETEEYANLSQQLRYAENEMTILNQRRDELIAKQNGASDSYKKLADTVKKAFKSVGDVLKKANATINSFGKRIKETFSNFTKSASDATKSANGFALSLKNILKYGFGIRSLYALINKIRSAIKEGFTNLYNDRDMEFFRNSIDNLKSSALTLKNALAAAFSPFVEIALPYVQKLLDYMTQLLNIAGQFFAAITGRKTYIKAIKQTTDALKEETKEMSKQLSPLDKLNNLSSQKGTGTDTGAAGTMFEEVPIANSILDMAEKIKDILSKLFAPLKEAWEREGKFVMDSWKYALDEVWKLIKDIGRDFLTVWQQEATVKIFEDLLHIIGDIGLVVGHLARNFREAWNESQTGLHILENIRDIIGVIIQNIRLAADQTVEWADKLNFKPLLESFERFTKSLIPLADALSGVLTDFYTHVLLPLAKWTIEKGLPELLDIFTAFNEKVDWQALRDNLAEFWDHLEPFAETIGEGLIIFIERVSDALADFLNSQEFKDFLVTIENWMDSVSPEDVADALEMIAKALISLKLALLGYEAIKGISSVLANITTFVSGLKAVGSAIVGWLPHIAVGVAIADVLKKIKDAMESRFDTSNWGVLDWISNTLETSLNGWKQKFDGFKISLELWWQDTWMSDAVWKFGQWWNEKIAPWFTKQKWSELWQNVKSTATEYFKSIATGISVEIENVTNKIKSKLEAIRTNFVNVFNSIKTTIVNIFNSIKTSIGNILDGISSKINSLSRALSNIGGGTFSKGTSRVPAGGSSLLPRTSTFSTYAINPALAALQDAEIPRLATGAVIPANREFLAVLGDQKHGTNVEAPLEMIEQANKKAILQVLSELGMTGSNNNNSGNNVYEFSVDGQVFFRIMQKYADEYFKQNGKYAFT